MEKFNLNQFKPCKEALAYYAEKKTFKEAWEDCERGDWMLWIALKLQVEKRVFTLTKGKCAELVIHLMKDERSKNAVRVAIAYGEGKATDEELKTAAAAAYAAAADAADAYAADADAYDAYAADAYAAAADADDAYAAYAYAADAYAAAADADAARIKTLKQCADISRIYLTEEIILKTKTK